LLALPGRPEYKWRNQKRHQKMNRDYFAQMHRIANVPLPPRPLFCPTDKEIDRAEKFLPDGFNIMWSLSGSSVHKAWPYTDQVIAQLLMDTDVNIIFVGDELCKLLEDAWENEPRVYQTCGEMDIRDTLTLARLVDMVVGPETGVLNCVAFEEIPKVLMLSHSSPVNIGGTWTNTEVITPRGVDCYPCHKLHYSFDTCNRDENTGGAMCAANIKPERVYKAITKHIREIA